MIRTVAVMTLASAFTFGCGIKEEVHNAALAKIDQLQGELNTANTNNEQLKAELADMQATLETARAKLSELGENVEQLLGQKGALATDLAATRAREDKLRREQEAQRKRLERYRQVIEKFQKLVSSGKLKIRVVRGRMVVEMASNILFPSGQAKLHDEGKAALAELAGILSTIDDRNFQVAGHTDNVPIKNKRFPSNWELSTARAVSVVKFLQDSGVQATTMSAAGYAEYQPAMENETEEGRAANRRIEIILMPNLDELPDLSDLNVN